MSNLFVISVLLADDTFLITLSQVQSAIVAYGWFIVVSYRPMRRQDIIYGGGTRDSDGQYSISFALYLCPVRYLSTTVSSATKSRIHTTFTSFSRLHSNHHYSF